MADPIVHTALDTLVDLMDVQSTPASPVQSMNLTEIEAKPLEWLIEGMIPRGKLTVLAGEPSVGTSLLALEMISRVSRRCRNLTGSTSEEVGSRFDSDLKNSSLLIVDQDELATTVRPRLEVMGADLSLVEILTPSDLDVEDQTVVDSNEVVDGKKKQARTSKGAKNLAWDRLNRDLSRLEAEITRLSSIGRHVGMVVVDPIDRYFTVLKRAADVATITSRFSELAWKLGVAIVAVARLKRTGLNRGFVNGLHSPACEGLAVKAPSVWVVAKDRTQLDRRYLLPEKNNLCRRVHGYAFSVRDDRVEWEQTPVTMTVEEYLRPKKPRRISELDRAERWLKQQLSVGPIPAVTIFQEGAGCFFSKITLRRAFHAMEGDSKKMGGSGHWWWTLPGDESEADLSKTSRDSELVPSMNRIIRPAIGISEANGQGDHVVQGDQGDQHCESVMEVAAKESREIERESQISDFQSQTEERPKRRLVRVRLSDLPQYKTNRQGLQDDQGDQGDQRFEETHHETSEVKHDVRNPKSSNKESMATDRVETRRVLPKKLSRREARNQCKQQKQAGKLETVRN